MRARGEQHKDMHTSGASICAECRPRSGAAAAAARGKRLTPRRPRRQSVSQSGSQPVSELAKALAKQPASQTHERTNDRPTDRPSEPSERRRPRHSILSHTNRASAF